MRSHTAEDLDLDIALLYQYETEGYTQAALAESVGLSQSQLSRRLARARRYRERWREEERLAEERARGAVDEDERVPYLSLTTTPGRERGHYYDLDTDACTLDSGLARVGDRRGSDAISGLGANRHSAPPLEGQRLCFRAVNGGPHVRDPGGPTKYEPDPAGLKGGVG